MNLPIDDPLAREFPVTNSLSREELEDILNRDDILDALAVQSVPPEISNTLRHILQSNSDLLARNEKLKSDLDALREETQNAYDIAVEEKQKTTAADTHQGKLLESLSNATQLHRLENALSSVASLSESLEPDLSHIDNFIEQHVDLRKRYHSRKIVAERFTSLQ